MADDKIEITHGNQVFAAVKRGNFGWDVEIRTPGPFKSGLTREQAEETLRRLRKAHCVVGGVRTDCPSCGRFIMLDAEGAFFAHKPKHPGPGVGPQKDCDLSRKPPPV